ncbi:hypothetical protein C6501_14950 [Candidatus Poribacteria bacterium]|nr:MAG: hypothetical protein C6501_14950 [Candidatus Poribacteria bacterium]
MKLRIEHFTYLLTLIVILLAGCNGCGQKSPSEIVDPSFQSDYSLAAANSRKLVKLPPFPEPSFEQLIEMFKADVKESGGDPDMDDRKYDVIENPELLWKEGFIVPKDAWELPVYFYEHRSYRHKPVMILHESEKGKRKLTERDYEHQPLREYTGKVYYYTKEQQDRWLTLPDTLSSDERRRKKYEIMLENVDPLDAARYMCSEGMPIPQTLGVEYAARAMRAYPDSVEAMRLWANAHYPFAARIAPYKQLLKKFPNSAMGHYELARVYMYHDDVPEYELAIEHLKKASLLDSRLPLYNQDLGYCYAKLGEWEKSLAVYQGSPTVTYGWTGPPSYTAFRKVQYILKLEHTGGKENLQRAAQLKKEVLQKWKVLQQ